MTGETCPDVIELDGAHRVGSSPQQRGSATGANCPDVLRLDDGSGAFLVIGEHYEHPEPELLARIGASVGETETAVIVPRDCLLTAARQLIAEDAGEADAKGAYEAYCVITEAIIKPGEGPVVPWDDVPRRAKAAWVNAAMGVRNRALMQAADKQRAWADSYGDTPTQGAIPSVIRKAAALIDPRDPRSLDG